MIGTPFHFSENEFFLHQSMCTLLTQHFGLFKVAESTPAKNLTNVIAELNRVLLDLLSVADQGLKLAPQLADLTVHMADLSITGTKKSNQRSQRSRKSIKPQAVKVKHHEPVTIPLSNEEKEKITLNFYNDLHARLNFCYAQCGKIFSTLHKHIDQTTTENLQHFHHVCSYFNLLGNILAFNMAVYQTHPIHKQANPTKINNLMLAINNWMILLESYHLDHGQTNTFEALRCLFAARYTEFKEQLCEVPEFVSIWPTEMLHPFSPEELEYHVNQKNLRAKQLGLPYNGLVVNGPVNSMYIASRKREALFFETLQKTIIKPEQFNLRTQLLFYYNGPFGNVDVFDICYNSSDDILEIINIHPGNSCAQHNFLIRLTNVLQHCNIAHRIVACQADLGPRQQNAALYALRLSSLVSQHSLAELQKKGTPIPHFHDEAHNKPISLDPIANITWFPVSAFGDKALLLNSDLEKSRALLGDKFAKYEQNYELSPADPRDPETLFTYADDYRRRLSYKHLLQNDFHLLSLDALKVKLNADDNGKMVRRAAAGHATSREFRFLVETFKAQDPNALHLPATPLEFTPLQWTLKARKPARAALLLTTVNFTEQELTEKNKDGKSACDYFNESKSPAITGNPVLKRFLKR